MFRIFVVAVCFVALVAPTTSYAVGTSPTTCVMKTKSRYINYRQAIKLWGALKDGAGRPLAGKRVALQASYGSGFKNTRWVTVSSTGSVWVRVRPSRTTCYRFRFPGNSTYASSVSREIWIDPKAKLSTPKTASIVGKRRPFTITGTILPQNAKSSRTRARVDIYRLQDGTWYKRMSFWVIAKNSRGASRYSLRIALPYLGKWRIRTRHSCKEHAASYSSFRYLRVR